MTGAANDRLEPEAAVEKRQPAGQKYGFLIISGRVDQNGNQMPRQYIHSTSIAGSTKKGDTDELLVLEKRAAGFGMSAQNWEDELARLTGFEDSVVDWLRYNEAPNGLVRRIILNCARGIVNSATR